MTENNGIPLPTFAAWLGCTVEELKECIVEGHMEGEVGYIGDYSQPLEYPCNCKYCRGEPTTDDDFD